MIEQTLEQRIEKLERQMRNVLALAFLMKKTTKIGKEDMRKYSDALIEFCESADVKTNILR